MATGAAKKPAAKKTTAKKAATKARKVAETTADEAAAAADSAVDEGTAAVSQAVEDSAQTVENITGKEGTRVFTPTASNKSKALRNRIIAWVCWLVAIALEIVAIFVVLRPSADALIANQGFPQNRWWILIAMLVVIAILAIVGNLLWKKANRLDPASRADKFRFFVQNQLGAIMTIIAFVPLIILILLNKDMSKQQKTIATVVGAVLAVGATATGVDTKPFSQEQAAVESNVITALTGQDDVYWSGAGMMHLCPGVSALANSADVQSGTVSDAFAAGSKGITLQLSQEFAKCFPENTIPEGFNMDDALKWICTARNAQPGDYATCDPFVS